MNLENVLRMVSELAMLKYFPANNEAVLLALVRLCGDMCHSEAEVRWLVDRMTSGIYSEWPGPAEMRACFCSRYPPKDGVNAYSSVYPDGLPPSKEARTMLAAAPQRALPAGHTPESPRCAESREVIGKLKDAMPKMPPVVRGTDRAIRQFEEAMTAPRDRPELVPTPQIINQVDIDRAVAEYHAKKAQAQAQA